MPFLTGLILGLSMILPIGPQNLFVLNQGLFGGIRRGLLAAAVAGVCDTALILAGAAGLSALFGQVAWLRAILLWVGVLFLLYLGVGSLRTGGEAQETDDRARMERTSSARKVALTAVAVSWGNPHAILDTVAVLGSIIAGREPLSRVPFAAGVVSASWLFFLFLALAGSFIGQRLTPRTQRWIRRGSGMIMLLFAVLLAGEAFLR